MQNADDVVSAFRRTAVFAFCILHFAFLELQQSLPHHRAGIDTARLALDQLRRDITQATQAPGVQRGVWGIVVHSLDRNERLFELQPRTLLVPASVAKLAAVCDGRGGGRLGLSVRDHARGHGPDSPTACSPAISWSSAPAIRRSAAAPERISRVGSLRCRRRASVASTAGSLATTTRSRSRGRSWRGPGTTSATRAGALFGALNYAENRMTVTRDAGTDARRRVSRLASSPTPPRGRSCNRRRDRRRRYSAADLAGTAARRAVPDHRRLHSALARRPRDWPSRSAIRRSGSPASFAAAAGAGHRRHRRRVGHRRREAAAGPDARAQVLFTHRSKPLRDIVQPLLKESINLYAEAVMRLNAAPGQAPDERCRAGRVRKAAGSVGRSHHSRCS